MVLIEELTIARIVFAFATLCTSLTTLVEAALVGARHNVHRTDKVDECARQI